MGCHIAIYVYSEICCQLVGEIPTVELGQPEAGRPMKLIIIERDELTTVPQRVLIYRSFRMPLLSVLCGLLSNMRFSVIFYIYYHGWSVQNI